MATVTINVFVRGNSPMRPLESDIQKKGQQTAGSECKTNVYIEVPMERDVVSVRIRPEIKQALKQYCSKNGLSICHVFEGLVTGFLLGINQKIEFVNKSPTMNVSVVREVRRPRRYAKEEGVEVGRCCFCEKVAAGSFVYVPTAREYHLCAFHAGEFVLPHGNWRTAPISGVAESQKMTMESESNTKEGALLK